MTQYRFRASALVIVRASGMVEASSVEGARQEALRFLCKGDGCWSYNRVEDDSIQIDEVVAMSTLDLLQKPLRIKVRRAFKELADFEFGEEFHDDLVYFHERLLAAKRPWKSELIEDARAFLLLAADRAGDCSLFNKGGQAYVALKAIKKCTL